MALQKKMVHIIQGLYKIFLCRVINNLTYLHVNHLLGKNRRKARMHSITNPILFGHILIDASHH
jgi:hypothetical protein